MGVQKTYESRKYRNHENDLPALRCWHDEKGQEMQRRKTKARAEIISESPGSVDLWARNFNLQVCLCSPLVSVVCYLWSCIPSSEVLILWCWTRGGRHSWLAVHGECYRSKQYEKLISTGAWGGFFLSPACTKIGQKIPELNGFFLDWGFYFFFMGHRIDRWFIAVSLTNFPPKTARKITTAMRHLDFTIASEKALLSPKRQFHHSHLG